uniref:Uncharacterized protein n=1 Tax=Anguilla anguilla TaxID=7936 RepID=A0A0E9UQA1_ANGAN
MTYFLQSVRLWMPGVPSSQREAPLLGDMICAGHLPRNYGSLRLLVSLA